jgi:C-terminal processing protease CtpA/Prc
MKHFLRPYLSLGVALAVSAALSPLAAHAQGREFAGFLQETSPLLLHSSSQGYLGVDLADVDNEKAQSLKLKEVRGALITLIDHDAPAGKVGLKVNDVVVQINGQTVESAEQLRRMLREIPAGRKVSLEISRDGNIQTLAVELADRRAMEHEIWNKLGTGGDDFPPPPGMGILSSGDGSVPSGFHMPFFGSSLNVGALVEPLTSQMAEYMGVSSGLMVKQVAHKSEAAAAGMKAFDVILKVGTDSINTLADWDRALHSNQGKPVQVVILRDKKQQTLTLQVDSKRKTGELEPNDLFSPDQYPELAELGPDLGPDLDQSAPPEAPKDDAAAVEALRSQIQAQAESLRQQAQAAQAGVAALLSQQKAEELRQQAEKLKEELGAQRFQIDTKQFDQLKQQMEQLRQNFKPEDFRIDPKQLDQMKQQMEQFRQQFKPQILQLDPKN